MVVVSRRSLTLALALTLVATAAWAQASALPAQPGFRVSWAPPTTGAVSTIKGSVFNDSPYRVTDVRLAVEGFDANHRFVGRLLTWAFGDIAPGGETGFATEPLPGAVDYRITVVSYDLVD